MRTIREIDECAPPTADRRRDRGRRLVGLLVPVAVAIVLIVLAGSGLSTARGRISASTRTQSLLTAGQIDLILEPTSGAARQELLFDEGGLYPGLTLERCPTVTYEGTFDSAAIRLHTQETGGDGLADFVNVRIERGSASDPDCTGFASSSTLYHGTLTDLLARHHDFDSGLSVAEPSPPGAATHLRVSFEVADTNEAQDLTTRFTMLFEARP